MAVTRIGSGAGGTSTGAAVTFNGPNITTSDANTVVIVGVAISVSSNSSSTTCSVTYGGTAMTQLNLTLLGNSTNRNARGLYYLFNPGTGTKSCVVTPAGASTKAQVRCQAVAFSGVAAGGVGTVQDASATSHSPTSVANGYNVRVLVNGATLSAPNQTQEYLAGASVSGDGDYMAMQSAAGTGSTISFTCTGTATNAGSSATALTPLANPKVDTLTDEFTTKDTAKWVWSSTATVTAGRADITTDSSYSGVINTPGASLYDLTSSSASVRVGQIAHSGVTGYAATMFMAGPTWFGNTVITFVIDDSGGAGSSTLGFNEKVGGTDNKTTITYDPVQHAYWRFRHASGTLYWETSPDSITWTTQRSKTPTVDLTSLQFAMQTGCSAGVTASHGLFDHFNLSVPPARRLCDDFSTKDTTKWVFDTGTDAIAGKARLQPNPSELHITATGPYDLIGSSLSVEVVQVSSQNTGFFIAVDASETNMFAMNYWITGGVIRMREFVGGSGTETTVTYDPVAHRFWRLREASGTIYWETSPDGVTWTTRRSKAAGNDYSSCHHLRLYADSASGLSTALFDNFNMPTSGLTDNFNAGLNSAQWGTFGTATVSGGQLVVTGTNSGINSSPGVYNLTDSSVYVQQVTVPNTTDATSGAVMYMMLQSSVDTTDREEIFWSSYQGNNEMTFRETINNITDQTAITYNATNHKWWRIRHSSSANLIYWDTSPDGVTWTNQRSKAPGAIDITSMSVLLARNVWTGTDPGGAAIFDNVNTLPAAAELTDQFTASIDSAKWVTTANCSIVGGQLSITPAGVGSRIDTQVPYNLRESSVMLQMTSVGAAGWSGIFLCHSSRNSNTNYAAMYEDTGGNLVFEEMVSGVSSATTLTYSATTHRWLRIRESAGTIYWDTAPDGVTWTNRRSKAEGLPYDVIYPQIYADGASGTSTFDNVNTLPAIAEFAEDFSTSTRWTLSTGATISGGKLRITADTNYWYAYTPQKYNFAGSSVSMEVTATATGAGSDHEICARPVAGSNQNALSIIIGNNAIYLAKTISGTGSDSGNYTTYSATNHRWVRLRESGGTAYLDVSATGASWTQIDSMSTGTLDVTSCNLFIYGSQTSGTQTVTIDTVNNPASMLTDQFTTQDTTKWTWAGGAAVASSQLQLPVSSSYGDSINSVSRYNLTGSSAYVQLVQRPNVGNGTTNAILQVARDSNNLAMLYIEGSNIWMRETVATVVDATSLAYDSVNHKWWRIRESGGSIFWDTSPDGVTWTNRRNKTSGIDYSNVQISVVTGYYGTEPSPGTAIFDNLNTLPAVAELTDNFTTSTQWTLTGSTTVSGGTLNIPSTTAYVGANTINKYNAVNSSVYAQISSVATGGTNPQSIMELRVDGTNRINADVQASNIFLSRYIGGVYTESSRTAYSATNHKWWRLRESAGTVYLDVSATGASWTQIASLSSSTLDLTSIGVFFFAGTDAGTGTNMVVDNVNTGAAVAANTGQFFAMF